MTVDSTPMQADFSCLLTTRWRDRGFTLLEMLVVLVIVGLLAGVALPQLQKLAASVEISNQRTNIKAAIEGLGYQAYVNRKAFALADLATLSAADGAALGQLLQIPPGWQLSIPQPIPYANNGVCGGGKLSIIDPNQVRESFVLKPPQCRLEPTDNSD
jgi:general secretion pathway protein G